MHAPKSKKGPAEIPVDIKTAASARNNINNHENLSVDSRSGRGMITKTVYQKQRAPAFREGKQALEVKGLYGTTTMSFCGDPRSELTAMEPENVAPLRPPIWVVPRHTVVMPVRVMIEPPSGPATIALNQL